MQLNKFVSEILNYGQEWKVNKIDKDDDNLVINIHVSYVEDTYTMGDGEQYKVYDFSPVRQWQHLSILEYATYIHCKLPRIVTGDKKVKVVLPPWAEAYVSYTRLFSLFVIQLLQVIQEQKMVATLCKTTETIVRSMMNNAVEKALEFKEPETNLSHISLDEKACSNGHSYATIMIDNIEGKVLEVVKGRGEEEVKLLYNQVTGKEKDENIKVVSMDMWRPFINATQESAPNSYICFDKFHIFKYLSDAINSTRKYELKHHPKGEILKKAKYTLLKNKENMTPKQDLQFKQIDYENFEAAKIWKVRENLKYVWESTSADELVNHMNKWLEDAYKISNKYLNNVLQMICNHIDGICNSILLKINNGFQ